MSSENENNLVVIVVVGWPRRRKPQRESEETRRLPRCRRVARTPRETNLSHRLLGNFPDSESNGRARRKKENLAELRVSRAPALDSYVGDFLPPTTIEPRARTSRLWFCFRDSWQPTTQSYSQTTPAFAVAFSLVLANRYIRVSLF